MFRKISGSINRATIVEDVPCVFDLPTPRLVLQYPSAEVWFLAMPMGY